MTDHKRDLPFAVIIRFLDTYNYMCAIVNDGTKIRYSAVCWNMLMEVFYGTVMGRAVYEKNRR